MSDTTKVDTGATRRALTNDEADVFAEIVHAGVPVAQVAAMFTHADGDQRVAEREWAQQPEVIQALAKLDDGHQWHELSDSERHQRALRQHYASLSYFLWSVNYSEVVGEARSKCDAARQALEAKVSGTVGRGDAVQQFYAEIVAAYKAKVKAREDEEAEEEEREHLEQAGSLPEWDS